MDYKKLGFMAGLEIHQQLDTNKLFCRCPSFLRKDNADFKIKRKLHKVAGETGEVDIAAQFEALKDKEFTYEGYNDTTCLIELDEEPPKEINKEALDIAIQISLLLNCEIVPVTQVMRKNVIDGSNTSGFQRTVLIARDGFIDTSKGTVGIWYVYLEEDAARTVSKEENKKTYRLDRLGVPLVEIVTSPDITTPEQAKETALKIGELIRACKVKRGIGTIRQDINISIKNSNRVEIKGFQDPKIMVQTVEKEIERQIKFVEKKERNPSEVRQSQPDATTKFLRPLPGGARMYPETDLPLLKISREQINALKKKLPKLKTEIKGELKNKGVSEELVNVIISKEENLNEFNMLTKVYNKDANLVAKMITLWRTNKDKLTEAVLEKILEVLNKKQIEKEDIKDIMKKISRGISFEKAIITDKTSHHELEEEITKIIKSKSGLTSNAYMGLVMAKFKDKLSPQKAMEIIKKILANNC
jgi:Glu-tRNA(Gln) amidotransferase subunit E-like FAD-binding protein